MYPRARTMELIIEELPSETIVYDTRRHRAHCLNKTAGFIWRQCDGQTSVEQMAKRLSQSTGMPPDEDIVLLGLRSLSNRGLIAAKPEAAKPHSRRELMGRLAVLGGAAAGLLPAVTSIVAPTPAMAQSGDSDESKAPKPPKPKKPKD